MELSDLDALPYVEGQKYELPTEAKLSVPEETVLSFVPLEDADLDHFIVESEEPLTASNLSQAQCRYMGRTKAHSPNPGEVPKPHRLVVRTTFRYVLMFQVEVDPEPEDLVDALIDEVKAQGTERARNLARKLKAFFEEA